MEPPNKGHIGTRCFVLYKEVSFIRRLKCTGIIKIGTSKFAHYREVSFIRSVLYRRFHCITFTVHKADTTILCVCVHILLAPPSVLGAW